MDLLEGWLGQYVHQALTEALRWKIQASQRPEPVEHPRFEDDGSNLRVKSMGKFLVQITKVCTLHQSNIQCLVGLMFWVDSSSDKSNPSVYLRLEDACSGYNCNCGS